MNPFKRGDPATRYEVGDEVEVNLGGAPSMLPPYPGWYRGVITKRWAVPREFDTLDQLPLNKFKMPPVFPYAVRTDHGVFPALKDDPDFVRGVAAKYNTGGPLRFAVGDVVECSIGPNEWMRGTVRELHIPSRGWGRGWDFEGNRLKGVVCDTMPYHVTPPPAKNSTATTTAGPTSAFPPTTTATFVSSVASPRRQPWRTRHPRKSTALAYTALVLPIKIENAAGGQLVRVRTNNPHTRPRDAARAPNARLSSSTCGASTFLSSSRVDSRASTRSRARRNRDPAPATFEVGSLADECARNLSLVNSEIVHIQGGQCGNQIGAKFWEVRRASRARFERREREYEAISRHLSRPRDRRLTRTIDDDDGAR